MSNLRDPTRAQLVARVESGLKWKLLSEATLIVTRMSVAIVLARLLTPRDFGIAGMVLVMSAFVTSFADFGLGNALVQRRSLSEKDRSTMFWASCAVGVSMTAIGVAVSKVAAGFYHEAQVRNLFAVLSLGFVITSLGATQRSLLSRTMDFRSLEIRSMAAALAGASVGITTAALGHGPWALILQSLTIVSVSTALVWPLVPWRPHLVFSWDSLRSLGGFGIRSVGGSFLASLNQVSDKLLIGRFLGAAPLGVYTIGYNTMLLPLTRIVSPIQQVLYPALSRLQDDPRNLATAWLRMNRAVGALCIPLMVGVMVTAPDLVPVAFGERWRSAVPILQILAWVGITQCLQGLLPVVLQVVNRPGTYLRFSGFALVVNIGGYAIGLHWAITGVATAYAISSTMLGLLYTRLTANAVGTSLRAVAASLAGVTQAALALAGATLATRLFLVHEGVPPWIRLLALVGVGAVVFVSVCFWRDPELILEVRGVLRRRAAPETGAVQFTVEAGTIRNAG
jgi:O-antigen/teichoic acid export membrane protein